MSQEQRANQGVYVKLEPGMQVQCYINDDGEDVEILEITRETVLVRVTKGLKQGSVQRVVVSELIINPQPEDLVFAPPSAAAAVEGGGQ